MTESHRVAQTPHELCPQTPGNVAVTADPTQDRRAISKFAATGLGPATSAAKRGRLDQAQAHFGKAVLGKEAFRNLSEQRLQQVRANFCAEDLLSDSYMLPLEASAVARVEAPTLLVTGAASPILFHRLTDRLAELLPNCLTVGIAGAAHIMHADNATEYNDVVLKFSQ